MKDFSQIIKISSGYYEVVFKGFTWSVQHDKHKRRWSVHPIAGGQIKGQFLYECSTKKEAMNWIKER